MHPRPLVLRHGEHAKGIVLAQVLLGGEGKLGKVCQGAQIRGVHAGGVKFLAVVRHLVIGVLQRPAQTLNL